MGMFNSIIADLRCPTKQDIGSGAEIQIKWQVQAARALTVYHLGDVLEDIEAEYDNTWIKTDYICSVCSRHTTGRKGITYIKTEDQQWQILSLFEIVRGVDWDILVSRRGRLGYPSG